MLKFKTNWIAATIEPVLVALNTESVCLHDSWEDARAFLIRRYEHDTARVRAELSIAQGKLESVKAMTKPEGL